MSIVKTIAVLFLVLALGVAWVAGEPYWIGLSVRWFYELFEFQNGTLESVMLLRSILSTALVQLVPSLAVAWLVSLVKPRRWQLYSGLVAAPQIVLAIVFAVVDGLAPYLRHGLTMESALATSYFLLWIQVPVLLLLIYKLGDLWRTRRPGTRGLKRQEA